MEQRDVTKVPEVSSEKPRPPAKANDASAQPVSSAAPRQVLDPGGGYLYAGPGRKPKLLTQLEGYVRRELHAVDPEEPQSQELKLQVYRDAFARFIEEFRTYQPLLGAIQKEYENTLVRLQDQIKDLKPLRSRVRLMAEECDRKMAARWDDGRARVHALEEDKRRLLKDMQDMREQEERQKAVVSRLQGDLAGQYRRYREEHDSRRLLILKHSLCNCFAEENQAAPAEHAYQEDMDPMKLKVALKVCRADLTNAQAELTRIQAEYWGVVPRRDWDALEDAHKRTLLQLQTLQGDFDQLKCDHDALLEVQRRDSMQAKSDRSVAQQEGEVEEDGELPERRRKPSLEERQLCISQLREQLEGKGLVSVDDVRGALELCSPAPESAAVDRILSLAFQVGEEELIQTPPQLELDAEILLQRLADADAPITGPLPQQDSD